MYPTHKHNLQIEQAHSWRHLPLLKWHHKILFKCLHPRPSVKQAPLPDLFFVWEFVFKNEFVPCIPYIPNYGTPSKNPPVFFARKDHPMCILVKMIPSFLKKCRTNAKNIIPFSIYHEQTYKRKTIDPHFLHLHHTRHIFYL